MSFIKHFIKTSNWVEDDSTYREFGKVGKCKDSFRATGLWLRRDKREVLLTYLEVKGYPQFQQTVRHMINTLY